MTEDEAKTKWCPLVGIAASIFFAARPATMPEGRRTCVRSDCMMWRWKISQVAYTGTIQPDGSIKTDPIPVSTDGHCGLAGQL